MIRALYSGECVECGVRWEPGELIESVDDPQSGERLGWQHARCPKPARPAEVACTTCWLTHPVGACDR